MLMKIARIFRRAIPESKLKKKLTALAFRFMYRKEIADYRYKKGIYTMKTLEGIELKSLKDFDPAPILEDFRHARIRRGASFMDLGGNLGMVAVYIAKRAGPKGKVYVFEPDEDNFRILTQNILLNRCENIIPVQKGVWNKNGHLEFFCGGNYTSSFHKTDYVQKDKKNYCVRKVAITTLDDAVKQLKIGKLDLIKIDIEGSEVQALEGGLKTLRKFKPALIVETHIIAGSSTEKAVTGLLKGAGYKKLLTYGPAKTPAIYARFA